MEHKGNKFKTELAGVKARIQSWCAYQERSQHETRMKLHELGVYGESADFLVADLISNNFLNEERFVLAFAGGKFRVKQWGRVKIKVALKSHKVSDTNLRTALQSIPADDYASVIRKLAEKKIKNGNSNNRMKNYASAYHYLVRRGFESDIVSGILNEVMGEIENHEFRT